MKNIKIILFLAAFLCILISCKNTRTQELFRIDYSVNKIIRNNQKCLKIFNKVFGVDSIHIKNNPYVESVINRFIEYNNDEKYERLIFLRLDEEGEVYNSTLLGIQIKNKKAIVTKYNYEDKQPKFVSKEINNFDPDNFLNSFAKEELKRNRNHNLLIIDFKSNTSCDCKFLGKFDFNINDLKDLSFFDRFTSSVKSD